MKKLVWFGADANRQEEMAWQALKKLRGTSHDETTSLTEVSTIFELLALEEKLQREGWTKQESAESTDPFIYKGLLMLWKK